MNKNSIFFVSFKDKHHSYIKKQKWLSYLQRNYRSLSCEDFLQRVPGTTSQGRSCFQLSPLSCTNFWFVTQEKIAMPSSTKITMQMLSATDWKNSACSSLVILNRFVQFTIQHQKCELLKKK